MSVFALQNDVPCSVVHRMIVDVDTGPSTLFSHCRANLLTFASDGGAFGPGEARPLTPFLQYMDYRLTLDALFSSMNVKEMKSQHIT